MTVLRFRLASLAITSTFVLAGCHDAAKGVGAQSAESHAPGTTMGVVPGSCGSYPKGAPGVINTFCNGPAKVTVTIDGKPAHSLSGGACNRAEGGLTLNLGVLATRELAGPRPDYVGLKAPVGQGDFDGAALVVNVDGKGYVVPSSRGTVTPTGGSFAGVTRRGHKVQATFTC